MQKHVNQACFNFDFNHVCNLLNLDQNKKVDLQVKRRIRTRLFIANVSQPFCMLLNSITGKVREACRQALMAAYPPLMRSMCVRVECCSSPSSGDRYTAIWNHSCTCCSSNHLTVRPSIAINVGNTALSRRLVRMLWVGTIVRVWRCIWMDGISTDRYNETFGTDFQLTKN